MELVVLIDEQNNVLGIKPKDEVHTAHTPLHRGFSLFLFNTKNELLVTKRALTKKTFPGVWTNTVCGHPAPDETAVDAAKRRLNHELGIMNYDIKDITEISLYRYQFADANGIVENEVCPILVAHSDKDPKPNTDEVEEWKWMPWSNFLVKSANSAQEFSPWCKEEAKILEKLLHLDG